ncbi:MAG: alpha-E domain-containing protein [Burkholderiaceae bacterium]|nr:alpha-E domain-containing protein [Burkholderiaceae bacterium]
MLSRTADQLFWMARYIKSTGKSALGVLARQHRQRVRCCLTGEVAC